MAVQRITKRVVDDLKFGGTVWDQDVRGFGVRRQAKDAVFVLKLRIEGRQRFITIGKHGAPWTVELARAKARSLLGQVVDGRDPASDRDEHKKALLVRDMADLFVSEHVRLKRKARTATSYEHILRTYVVPAFGDKPVAKVRDADVAKLHGAMQAKPYQANRTVAVIGAMYVWAGKRGLIDENTNPTRRIELYREHRRERFLTKAELERLGAAIHEAETVGVPWQPDPAKKMKHAANPENRRTKIDPYAAAALRLLLLTGARLREILHLQWEHVDLERGMLLLPDSKTGRKAIVLNGPAIHVLAGLERVSPFVFPGRVAEKPRSDLKRPWALVSSRAVLTGVRIHDLRHSFAAVGAGGGFGLPIIGKLLGHTQTSTTARYAHLDNDPVRRASERIGADISAALSGTTAGRPHRSS